MTEDKKIENASSSSNTTSIASPVQPKQPYVKLSLFDRLLNKSRLFCNAVTVTLNVLQRNQLLEQQVALLTEELKTHERSIIDLYERNGIIVQHVQASQRMNTLDLRLPDVKGDGGEKPN